MIQPPLAGPSHRKRHDVTTKSHKGVPFSWSDPFLLDDQLTEEERMIRETAAAFAADRLAPRLQKGLLVGWKGR